MIILGQELATPLSGLAISKVNNLVSPRVIDIPIEDAPAMSRHKIEALVFWMLLSRRARTQNSARTSN